MAATDLRLANHCRLSRVEVPRRLDLVEADPARHPAIGEAEVVERIEDAGRRDAGKPQHGQHAQVRVAELGLDAAEERRVAQDRIEMAGDLGHDHRMALGADRAVQVGQRLGIAERLGLRQDGGQHLERSVGLGLEPRELRKDVGFHRLRIGALVQHALGAALALRRREIEQGEAVAALMMRAIGAEGVIALLVDQPRRGIGEACARIVVGRNPLGLEEQRPTFAEAPQDVVEPGRHRHQLGLRGAVEVGAAVAQRALEGAVLVEHDPRRNQARPRQVVGQRGAVLAVLSEAQHDSAPLWRA